MKITATEGHKKLLAPHIYLAIHTIKFSRYIPDRGLWCCSHVYLPLYWLLELFLQWNDRNVSVNCSFNWLGLLPLTWNYPVSCNKKKSKHLCFSRVGAAAVENGLLTIQAGGPATSQRPFRINLWWTTACSCPLFLLPVWQAMTVTDIWLNEGD